MWPFGALVWILSILAKQLQCQRLHLPLVVGDELNYSIHMRQVPKMMTYTTYEAFAPGTIKEVAYDRLLLFQAFPEPDRAISRKVVLAVMKSGIFISVVSHYPYEKSVHYFRIDPCNSTLLPNFDSYIWHAHVDCSAPFIQSVDPKVKLVKMLGKVWLANQVLLDYLKYIAPLKYIEELVDIDEALRGSENKGEDEKVQAVPESASDGAAV